MLMKDKQEFIISYKMYTFQPCFKMNNIFFSMFFFLSNEDFFVLMGISLHRHLPLTLW